MIARLQTTLTTTTTTRLLLIFGALTVIDVLQTVYATQQGCYELNIMAGASGLSNFLVFKLIVMAVVCIYLAYSKTRWIALLAVSATALVVVWNTVVLSLLLFLGPIC